MYQFKCIIITSLTLGVSILMPTQIHAQIKPQNIRISVFSEATTMPTLKPIQLPLHPGILLGTDVWSSSGKHWHKALGAELCYYHHRLYEHAIMLDASYRIGYQFKLGLAINLLSNIGYKHSILEGPLYKFKNGSYEKSMHSGRAQFNAKLGLGLSYNLNSTYSITTDYKIMMATPYAPKKEMPFALHSFLGIGVRINLSKEKPEVLEL